MALVARCERSLTSGGRLVLHPSGMFSVELPMKGVAV